MMNVWAHSLSFLCQLGSKLRSAKYRGAQSPAKNVSPSHDKELVDLHKGLLENQEEPDMSLLRSPIWNLKDKKNQNPTKDLDEF